MLASSSPGWFIFSLGIFYVLCSFSYFLSLEVNTEPLTPVPSKHWLWAWLDHLAPRWYHNVYLINVYWMRGPCVRPSTRHSGTFGWILHVDMDRIHSSPCIHCLLFSVLWCFDILGPWWCWQGCLSQGEPIPTDKQLVFQSAFPKQANQSRVHAPNHLLYWPSQVGH